MSIIFGVRTMYGVLTEVANNFLTVPFSASSGLVEPINFLKSSTALFFSVLQQ